MPLLKFATPAIAATTLLLTHLSGSAEVLKYDLVGPQHAIFYIDTAAIPDEIDNYPLQQNFQYFGVHGSVIDNGHTTPTTFTAAFFSLFNGGGMDVYSTAYDPTSGWHSTDLFFSSTDSSDGTSLYSGPVTHASLLKGTFQLVDWFQFDGSPLQTWTLTVSSVPEPSTWASLSAGFLLLAFMRRSNRLPFIGRP